MDISRTAWINPWHPISVVMILQNDICLKGKINLYKATLCEKITLQSTLKLRDFYYIPGTGLGDSVCQNTIIDPSDSNI